MRKKFVWGLLMAAMAMFFMAVGWKIAGWHLLREPQKIVPAAVILPPDGRLLRDERERVLLDSALGVLQRRFDSLAADPVGRRIYDSIVELRPGLLDSLKMVTKYFLYEKGRNH